MSAETLESAYPAAWHRYRLRRRIAVRLLALGLGLLLGGAVAAHLHQPWAPIALAFAFPALMLANLVWISGLLFRCPRCGRRFTSNAGSGSGAPFDPFARACLNCRLPLRVRPS